MNKEILDDFVNEDFDNKKPISRIIQISIGVILLFFLLEVVRKFLPETLFDREGVQIRTLFDREGVQIRTIGLIIMGIVIWISIIIPNYLNKFKPKLSEIEVVVYTGLVIFAIEIVFKALQNIILIDNGFDLDYLEIIKVAGIMGSIGMLIANVRIHKIRSKKTLIPILLLLGIWIVIGLFLKR